MAPSDLERILQTLSVADGWREVCRCAESLTELTASWSQLDRERTIKRFVDSLKERNCYRYQRA